MDFRYMLVSQVLLYPSELYFCLVLIITNHTSSQFVQHFLSCLSFLSVLRGITLSSPSHTVFCVLNLYFFPSCPIDTGGCVHIICHDSWDQAELDRGFEEMCSAQQLSRPYAVSDVTQSFKSSSFMVICGLIRLFSGFKNPPLLFCH